MQYTDAVIAKRVDSGRASTAEIRQLAEAAGYEVVGELTQSREADPTYEFGRGKAEELAELVGETGAGTVVFDNELTPTQTCELAALCGESVTVLDRYRLVLDIFERQAGTKRAKLQVEYATLKWELPRIRESADEQAMNRFTESGTRYYDVRDRIDELNRKLADLADDAATRREKRREEGFEFVALVGYTNAGKSTLLHRLADELDFETREPNHDDVAATAAVEDRLFKTLDTTTRRATIDGHRTLLTDTVGFVDDLPHEMVESFHGTLSETHDADCVVLVADASDDPEELRRKLATSLDILRTDDDGGGGGDRDGDEPGDSDGERDSDDSQSLVVALNKVDRLRESELDARTDAVADLATEFDGLATEPVAVSATEGRNLDALCERVATALPDLRRAQLRLPNDDEAMSLVSWLYDRASVTDVAYGNDDVRIAFEARPTVVERARARAGALSQTN